jgi:ectoine hydroxylase
VPSQAALAQLAEGGEIGVATGRAGTVLMFDCNTMHGSAGNITPHARSNLFVVYNAVSNRLVAPFSGQPPRPEYIAHRADVAAIEPLDVHAEKQCR